jgi:hypothetical protein
VALCVGQEWRSDLGAILLDRTGRFVLIATKVRCIACRMVQEAPCSAACAMLPTTEAWLSAQLVRVQLKIASVNERSSATSDPTMPLGPVGTGTTPAHLKHCS